jgi:hypothetical protein
LDNYTAMKWRSVPLENNRGPFFAYHWPLFVGK